MIQIKNPCDANWQQMTPQTSGKFCVACEKVVVDFSKMNDDAIKDYFISYSDQKTCGRFLITQLDRPLQASAKKFFNTCIHTLNQLPVVRTVLLLITSMSVWISGCVKNSDMTTGEPISVDSNSTCTTSLISDTTAIISHPNRKKVQSPDTNQVIKMGEVAAPQTTKIISPPVVMRDIAIEEDTVVVNMPCTPHVNEINPEDDIRLIKGKVMMVDTISQKIKKRK